MTTLVRAACLTHFEAVARAGGLDPWQLLRQAGLPPASLTDPDLKIPAQAVRALLEEAAGRSGQEAFALLMAEGRRVSNLGVLGMLLREEPTLRQALQTIVSHSRTHNEALYLRIEEADGIATLHEEFLVGEDGSTRQATELVVAVALRTMRLFLGDDWTPRRICFTHAAPVSLATHRRVLGTAIDFSADFNGIVCASRDLDTPIASADPVVARYVRQQLADGGGPPGRASDEVRQMVLVLLPRGQCTVERVARHLGVNRRTLHRHLEAEGISFQAIVQATRRELGARYVREGRRPLTEVAQQLGFANLSAFSRWYRTVFGEPATQQRGTAGA